METHPGVRPMVADERVAVVSSLALLQEIRCAVCFGVPRAPVALKVCMHRMCQACFDRLYATKTRSSDKERPEKVQCPMCKAELSSKRVAVPDKQFEGLLAALYAHEEDGANPAHAGGGGGAEEEDDMDELMALCAQARQLKQVEESHALEKAQAAAATAQVATAAAHASAVGMKRRGRRSAKTAEEAEAEAEAEAEEEDTTPAAPPAPTARARRRAETIARRAAAAATAAVAAAAPPFVTSAMKLPDSITALHTADVVSLLVRHPSDRRSEGDDLLGAVRCYGFTPLSVMRKYVATRLLEAEHMRQGGDAVPMSAALLPLADGSNISMYITSPSEPTSIIALLPDVDVTLAQLYFFHWRRIDVPLVLAFRIGV